MFKIYQLTQKIAYESYTRIIEQLTRENMYVSMILIIVGIAILCVWIKKLERERRKMTHLYARFLLVPFDIVKGNVRMVNSFKRAVEYTEEL